VRLDARFVVSIDYGQRGNVPFGQILRDCRFRAGLSQEELAELAGVSARTICNIERGRPRKPYPRSVRLLADALQLAGRVRREFLAAAQQAGPSLNDESVNGDAVARASMEQEGPSVGQLDSESEYKTESWVAPQQLPSAVTDFVGRERQILQLTAALDVSAVAGVPAAVICGQPGMGKTTLALQVAHSLRSAFPDGQLWVHLAGASARTRDPGEVLGELLRALGVHGSAIPNDEAERAALYRSRLADRRVLLVIDDAASSAQVRPLLPGTAGSAVLVTSRTQLAGLPGAALFLLDAFTQEEAADLLARLVGQERIVAEPEAAGELANACGFMPLAVRIAGARLATHPTWPVSLLVEKMTRERRRLDELQAEDLSVRVSIALSYEALNEQAQRAFRLLGLLGPNDVAEWVVAALLGQFDAAAEVNELTEKSLLTPTGVDATGQARYRLHDLVREYARERVTEEPQAERDAALGRALQGWLQLADAANHAIPCNPYFPPTASSQIAGVVPAELAARLVLDPLAWFNAERLNLLEAVQRAGVSGWHDLAIELALQQADVQYLQNRPDEATQVWDEIVGMVGRSSNSLAIAQAELRFAAALVERGQAADAMELLDHCIHEFESRDDQLTLVFALYWRTATEYDLGRFDAVLCDGERGVVLAQQIGSQSAELLHLREIGSALATLGRGAEGILACKRAVFLADELGQEPYCLVARLTLAYVYVLVGHHDWAAALCAELLKLTREIADVRDEGVVLGLLGDAYHGLGRYPEAARALSTALPIFRDHANRRYYGLCLLKLGYTCERMGQNRDAADYLKRSLQVFQELHLRHYEQRVRDALANGGSV
jgi:transcriptional regulator with XRE-family HTH domain/tetratricopeptide (TPR) repeat protein